LRKQGGVAEENAVALVSILQFLAIFVNEALTGNLVPMAFTVLAEVVHCAWITVVATLGIDFVNTSCLGVTTVIGAGIRVFAIDLRGDAQTFFADTCFGARVTVVALGAGQGFVQAPFLATAGV